MKDDTPAFPEAVLSGLPNDQFIHGRSGMTLRDYFAAKVLQGVFSDPNVNPMVGAEMAHVAQNCYVMADVMIEARK
jgi:hypothetical protein